MSNFKIIAIRTGKRLEKKGKSTTEFLKVLAPETVFPFYSHFTFPQGNFEEIVFDHSSEVDLYNLDYFKTGSQKRNKRKSPYINVNAIVGVNGSGKSSLIELLYWGIYNIGCQLQLLEWKNEQPATPHELLDFEVLYTIDQSTFRSIVFQGPIARKQHYSVSGNTIKPSNKGRIIRKMNDLTEFFYTVAINYSHYALNTREMGDWLYTLFHKNDGYQTPIVLNPLRDEGQIDMNKETYLLGRRLMANVLEPVRVGSEERSLRNLGNGKIAKYLVLNFGPHRYQEQTDAETRQEILLGLKLHFNVRITNRQLENDFYINISLKYIEQKLFKIAYGYIPYFKYRDPEAPRLKNIPNFLKELKDTDSHITFKIKGAILYIKYFKRIFRRASIRPSTVIQVDIDRLSRDIAYIASRERFAVNTFMMVPPTFFDTEIFPENGGGMSLLSSGEKQRIHSISSIVYHIINLNSVERLKKRKSDDYIAYNSISIILDEIELYYHPEWQRRYVADLLDYIYNIGWHNIKHIHSINITFLTHSPYILSDIPMTNVLRLQNGRPITNLNHEQTFGANIHELLAKDFFMEKGFLGEWSKRHIENVIGILNKILDTRKTPLPPIPEQQRAYVEKIINIIGEPVIKNKLVQMLAMIEGVDQQQRIAKEKIEAIAKNAGITVSF